MKTVSTALRNHLRSRSTTLCTCVKVTRQDGEIFGFTNNSRSIDFAGVTYLATSGFTRTAIASSSDLSTDNLEAEGIIDSEIITETDLLIGRWDYARVEVFMLNYEDTSMGPIRFPGGRIGEVRQQRSRFFAELRGLTQNLQQTIGRLFQPACRADVFDEKCGLDVALFTSDGAVTAVTDRRTFVASAMPQATGYFDEGLLTFQSGGDNTGLAMEVKEFAAGGAFLLAEPMPYTIAVGNHFSVYPGCGKRLIEDCKTKFNNVVNFRGEPYLPGMDRFTRGNLK